MTMSYKNTVMILNKLNPHRLANHKYTAKTHFYENVDIIPKGYIFFYV